MQQFTITTADTKSAWQPTPGSSSSTYSPLALFVDEMQQLSNALEDNAWRDLSQNSRLAFHHAKYDQAINASTLALENLTRALVAILDIRAASHGKKAEFTQGLRDAFKMIEHVPTLSAGYLRAGNLYAIRGKQADAERIYEQGLRAVSPVLDQAGYSLLSEHKEAAKAQQEQRINFVHFPIEICAHIFSYLSMDTLFGCMSVSRLWRDRILQCASAWYQIELSASSKYAASMYHHFGSLSRHVRSMSLDLSWSSPPNRIPSQLVNGGFTNLRTLKLQGKDHNSLFFLHPSTHCFLQNINILSEREKKIN